MNFGIRPRKISSKSFAGALDRIHIQTEGAVTKVIGNVAEAKLPIASLGTLVGIESRERDAPILGEIVGFRDDTSLVLVYESMSGVEPGARIKTLASSGKIRVGPYLLGHVVDSFLKPLFASHMESSSCSQLVGLDNPPPNPMKRARISTQLQLGVRAIDGLLCFGEGQRVGIMAGSGVGKSVLLGMVAQGSEADVNVIALIGERGRELREFIERDLGSEGLKRSVVIAATSDQSPLLRVRAAKAAVSVCEYFSSLGKKVVLMMDSLSRVAQAQREIGLAIGEPPTSRGYPASVFALLPQILERCGPQEDLCGSISGLFTVLVDGDDFSDPIPDAARSILDGHINLSRTLANKGHYPAIDISSSVSRVMLDICPKEQLDLVLRFRELISTYNDNIDLVQMGGYQAGVNPVLDQALRLMPRINQFLKQRKDQFSSIQETIAEMIKILEFNTPSSLEHANSDQAVPG